jgi:phosphate transporter
MGGIALGKGVVSSGLLDIMGIYIEDMVAGFSLYAVVLILSPIVLVRVSVPSQIPTSILSFVLLPQQHVLLFLT